MYIYIYIYILPINFIVHNTTMEHPDKSAITKL